MGSTARNRVHLDLTSLDRVADVKRLVSLGASISADHADHIVLTDSEGNEFCLYDRA